MDLKVGQQIYLNKKYFLDVITIDKKLTVRIKYKEGKIVHYKNISLPLDLFKDCKGNDKLGLIYCNISTVELRKNVGGLINKMVKEPNIYDILENAGNVSPGNTGGMGAVSNPGLSGVPGHTGTMGSGDINTTGSHFNFGLEKIPASNRRHLNLLINYNKSKAKEKKSKKKNKIKEPVLNVINLKETIGNEDLETENDYKLKLFTFLDYPFNTDNDNDIIESIAKHRDEFAIISTERIQSYLSLFYKFNKTYIISKGSDYLINEIKILANL